MAFLQLNNIRKSWSTKIALDGVSFSAAEGEFIALLGPSGCGKTTLLRTIAGLEQADSGTISIKQREVNTLPPCERQLSMVFQNYALFPHLTVRENLLFGVKARGENKRDFATRLAEICQLMDLTPLLDRRPSQLSGGQQQRVALGRAIIARHKLCLMDEPLSNLDAKLRQTMRREIRTLQKNLQLTMLYVTHDQTEAMSMADHIVLLNDGRIEQTGTPNELYNQPASIFVAQFIGSPSMNIIPLLFDGVSHTLGYYKLVTDSVAKPLSLGLRAESISITAVNDGKITASILNHEYMGADTLILCKPDMINQADNTNNIITVKIPGMRHFIEGSKVGLNWPDTMQYLFFTNDGQRCYAQETEFQPIVRRLAT